MSAPTENPGIVARAHNLSRTQGFLRSCRNETGRLLAALAATRTGTLAEFGTGCGVGSAWLLSGMRDEAHLVTAELDAALAGMVQDLFADQPRAEVIAGDWSLLTTYAPYSLLFVDSAEPKQGGRDLVVDLVEPGGMAVLDDFTPCATWPPMYEGRVDTLREQWLTDERFTAVEVMVTPDASVIVATRR
ncbi:MAG: O-methyltransferase [Nocardioidaceae bacterium]